MNDFDSITNRQLIDNGLAHIGFEFNQNPPSLFRIARESHQLFLRSMIQTLRGTSNLVVIGKRAKNPIHQFSKDGFNWREVHRVAVQSCEAAWRYSIPAPCSPPPESEVQLSPDKSPDQHLIHFYHALAMIQSECFMTQYFMSRPIVVADNEMRLLEWLHEDIRNEYEHFVPKSLSASSSALLEASALCMRLSIDVLFHSKNAIIHRESANLEGKMSTLLDRLSTYPR